MPCQPSITWGPLTPSPRRNRPPDMDARLIAVIAISAGVRVPACMIPDPGLIEVVDADEEQRFAPVEHAEEAVGDRLLEPRRRIGTQGALEQGLAIVVECREPLGSGVVSHGGPLVGVAPLTRRQTVECPQYPLTEVASGVYDVGHHLVRAPLARR